MRIVWYLYYRVHELALYTSTAKIINYIANFVFIVYFQSRVTPGDSWKTPISFFSPRVPFYVPFADPPKYYYLVGFLRFGNHDQSGPLYDPMSCIPLLRLYLHTRTHTYKYIIYMCYILFFYFIVILLYYIPPITYYRCGGSSGGLAGAPVFLYRRYLRSCKRFTIHFGALVVVVRPDGIFLCTYDYYLYYTRYKVFLVIPLVCIIYIYIYVCLCLYIPWSDLFMLLRGPITKTA